jgi:hypothetical protein
VVEVSNNGVDFSKSKTVYYFLDSVFTSNVSSMVGPRTGGTNVTFDIAAAASTNFTSVECAFGKAHVPAIPYGSSFGYFCIAPAYASSSEGSVPFQVILDGYLSTAASQSFYYLDIPEKVVVSPLEGPENGGWSINIQFVTTDGKASKLPLGFTYCQFAGKVLAPVATYRDGVSCIVPALPIGSSTVELLLEGGASLSVGTLTTTVQPVASTIVPAYGPVRGNQVLTIYGSGFDQSDLCCELNGVIQAVASSNATAVTCVTPQASSGRVPIRVVKCGAHAPYRQTSLETPTDFMWRERRLLL